MGDKIEFGKAEYKMLIELKDQIDIFEDFRIGMETRESALEQEIKTLKKVVAHMVWASTKVTVVFAGILGGATWLGYWLMNSNNYTALKGFIKAIDKSE